ncbi:hypothetical protein LOTGIDRAFT_154845 [Lottia gigantea]|uniref:MD-2-related lipid-recognition domain-containing protein n=1 Tax=Lottia gigantea TaxID=225164 RepID=V3ZXN3_LOTGI|nr:hypothetical protein LOTGIDRAFT_154845 [Lottia gigantea]ESO87350.1 hypothetical protein LOTGIDRAFT_154845 [Lottia gigantea]
MTKESLTGSTMVPYKFYIGKKGCCSMILFTIVILTFVLYVTYFQRPPTDELLRMNSKIFQSQESDSIDYLSKIKKFKSSKRKSDNNSELKDSDGIKSVRTAEESKGQESSESGRSDLSKQQSRGRDTWQTFLKANNYVSIGEIYNSCEKSKRLLIGHVLLLPDPKYGGVMARTHMNFSTEYNVTGGEFYIDVKYNDKDLYDNHWELCELAQDDEDEEDQRLVACPLAKGPHSFVQDRNIPYYLPKGKYETNVWITDQTEEVFLCGRCVFVL